MVALLPQFSYVSFAAPLIREALQKDMNRQSEKWLTVLNYFDSLDFQEPKLINGRVRLVWFSQNIDTGRGLELVLPFIKKNALDIELHLFGSLKHSFYEKELKGFENITIHAPISQKELHEQMAFYDVGLALDIPVDTNRELAVTNKLLVYLQSGLYILATHTPAQANILQHYPIHGVVADISTSAIAIVLHDIVSTIDNIRNGKIKRFNSTKNTNWESESLPLTKIWTDILSVEA